jgi:sec-independent protein translocase protein TatC
VSATDTERPLLEHLIELRDRLIRILIAVGVVFAVSFPFSNAIYGFVSEPLRQILVENTSMIATSPISPFLTPFKLTLIMAFYVAIPYVLYQIWAFIAPGLYNHEKKLVVPLAVSSTFLFYLGMLFAYFVVMPLVFGFMAQTTPGGVAYTPDIKEYLDFVLKMFFAFGVAFEVPVATILLVKVGVTTPDSLAAKRPYIIVGAFIVGMLLTPPDIISQTLLALPMWLLFEIGLFVSRKMKLGKEEEEDDDYDEDDEGLSEEEMEAELDRIEAMEDKKG